MWLHGMNVMVIASVGWLDEGKEMAKALRSIVLSINHTSINHRVTAQSNFVIFMNK